MADKPRFYEDALIYWSNVNATVNGMLGGFGKVTDIDLESSRQLLDKTIEKYSTETHRALDCGAGIGRITKGLLLPVFDSVDLVDVTPKFIEEAKEYIGDESCRVGEFFVAGLQDFTPRQGYYDVIWCQWVLGHLSDEHFVKFFQRCKEGVKHNGFVIVKENASSLHATRFDNVDSSYTRPKKELVRLILESGLTIEYEEKQENFPKSLLDVWSFVCR